MSHRVYFLNCSLEMRGFQIDSYIPLPYIKTGVMAENDEFVTCLWSRQFQRMKGLQISVNPFLSLFI